MKIKRNCKNCDDEFYKEQREINAGAGVYCCRKCADIGHRLHKIASIKCKNCNKLFTTTEDRIKSGRGIYCSLICYREYKTKHGLTDEQRKRIQVATKIAMNSTEIQEKVKRGMANPIVRKNLSEKSTKQMALLKSDPIKFERFCAKQSLIKTLAWKKLSKKEKQRRTLVLRERGLSTHLNLLKTDMEYRKNYFNSWNSSAKSRNTKPERLVKFILDNNKIIYEFQYQLDNKSFDFYIPEKNLLIEVDGVYWHSKNLRKNEMNAMQIRHHHNDIIKNKLAKKSNYNIIRVWEDEIDECELIKRIHDI